MRLYFANWPRAWMLAALLVFQPATSSIAAEADEERAAQADRAPADELPPDTEGRPGEPAAPPGNEAEPKASDDPAVFVPTEEISEDFAVPFPVDI